MYNTQQQHCVVPCSPGELTVPPVHICAVTVSDVQHQVLGALREERRGVAGVREGEARSREKRGWEKVQLIGQSEEKIWRKGDRGRDRTYRGER